MQVILCREVVCLANLRSTFGDEKILRYRVKRRQSLQEVPLHGKFLLRAWKSDDFCSCVFMTINAVMFLQNFSCVCYDCFRLTCGSNSVITILVWFHLGSDVGWNSLQNRYSHLVKCSESIEMLPYNAIESKWAHLSKIWKKMEKGFMTAKKERRGQFREWGLNVG